jgi:hypothetical protein
LVYFTRLDQFRRSDSLPRLLYLGVAPGRPDRAATLPTIQLYPPLVYRFSDTAVSLFYRFQMPVTVLGTHGAIQIPVMEDARGRRPTTRRFRVQVSGPGLR